MRHWLVGLSVFWGLLVPGLAAAVSDQLLEAGPQINFTDSGSGDVIMTTANITTATGRISDRHDLGSGDRPFWYELRCSFQLASAGTIGNTLEIYVSTADTAQSDGGIGISDASLAADKRNNLKLVMLVITDTTATNTPIAASAIIPLFQRYVSVGYWSNFGATTRNTPGSSYCKLTPFNVEAQ